MNPITIMLVFAYYLLYNLIVPDLRDHQPEEILNVKGGCHITLRAIVLYSEIRQHGVIKVVTRLPGIHNPVMQLDITNINIGAVVVCGV